MNRLLSVARGAVACLVVGALGACGPAGDGGDDPDAGPLGEVRDDAGEDGEMPAGDACDAFVARTCGPGGIECLDAAACQAAMLIDRYEEGRCAEANADTFVYPSCEADACQRLVDRVCGGVEAGAQTCGDRASCGEAERLWDQLRDAESTAAEREQAREACLAGLQDALIFPACD